jgi:Domain of unknown function (DUF4342)
MIAAPRALPPHQEEPMDPIPEPPKPTERKFVDEIKVTGENLLKTIRELIHEGNFRRISIRNEEGHTLFEIPLAIGLVGALLAPVWAAVGAMAAMATGFSIIVERPNPPGGDGSDKTPSA